MLRQVNNHQLQNDFIVASPYMPVLSGPWSMGAPFRHERQTETRALIKLVWLVPIFSTRCSSEHNRILGAAIIAQARGMRIEHQGLWGGGGPPPSMLMVTTMAW